MDKTSQESSDFQVDWMTSRLSQWVWKLPGRAVRLGYRESRWFAEELQACPVQKPVFIAGLARSGTTILLEFMATLEGVATHRYRDFPLVHIPVWWNKFLDLTPRKSMDPVERSHRDGIRITPESPEAMEEPIWMSFFPLAHDSAASQVLDAATVNPAFEAFFRDHLSKILFVRKGRRYVSKGNYNVTRLEYLLRVFPDALFVVPVREPAGHVASLMKQNRIFTENLRGNSRALEHLRRVGHFEFGPDRRVINAGDTARAREVEALWAAGEEVRGWARYWASIHGFLADRMESNQVFRKAVRLVQFEELCERPATELQKIAEHGEFADAESGAERFAERIRFPRYYAPSFSEADGMAIREETAEVIERLMSLRQQ
ncbi:MAG: sulfotransferase [bacterium]